MNVLVALQVFGKVDAAVVGGVWESVGMPRAMWKGAVSFGLVNVPVKLYSATEDHDISFRQVHREDGGRIHYKRVCAIDGEEVSYDDIAKGYETEDGEMVVITDDDLKNLPNQSSKEIAVEKFVPSEQVDPMLLDRSYYLEPEKGAAKAYALLRDAWRPPTGWRWCPWRSAAARTWRCCGSATTSSCCRR